ncbi:hypothetical protein BJ912DRAFT_1059294 [Pholiota molesta]|nr:hypothetical protein BJ912DRAFT_1059294 [Pholiota molesta]
MHAERTLGGVRALGTQIFTLVHAPVHPAPTRVLLTNQHTDAVSFGVLPSPSLRLNAHAQHGHLRISAQSQCNECETLGNLFSFLYHGQGHYLLTCASRADVHVKCSSARKVARVSQLCVSVKSNVE